MYKGGSPREVRCLDIGSFQAYFKPSTTQFSYITALGDSPPYPLCSYIPYKVIALTLKPSQGYIQSRFEQTKLSAKV